MTGALAAAWLLWYAYNGPASAQAFAAIAQSSPQDPAALLGEITAFGPDLNTEQSAQRFARARQAIAAADALQALMSPEQRELFHAQQLRYGGAFSAMAANNRAYRRAIAGASDAFPQDDTLALLAAEALAENGDDASARTFVERVQSDDPNNVMAAHLCIHVEAPEQAIPCANVLEAGTFTPATEHLAHMSAHTWIQTGAYGRAVTSSERAWQLIESLPTGDEHRLQYQQHDLYVGFSAAMMGLDYAAAKQWALRSAQLGDAQAPAIAAMRFGKLDDVPQDARANPAIAGWIAARSGNLPAVRAALGRLDHKPHTYVGFLCEARMDETLGRNTEAHALYDRAVTLQHNTYSGEAIPLWPAETAEGGFLLRTHDIAGAQHAFEAALKRYPHDPRAELGMQVVRDLQSGGAGLPGTVDDL